MDRGNKRKDDGQMLESSDTELSAEFISTFNKNKQNKPNPVESSPEEKYVPEATRRQNAQNSCDSQNESSSTEESNREALAIGIDLGNAKSRVAVFRNGKVEFIPNEHGSLSTPSYVAFTDTFHRLFGDDAKNKYLANQIEALFDFKMLICTKSTLFTDKSKKVFYQVEELFSMMLGKMKQIAETYLGQSVTDAVITVPPHFTSHKRQTVKDCAAIAHLNVLQIVDDTAIAAQAYAFQNQTSNEHNANVLIFDLGKCACNVSIVSIKGGYCEVKATTSDCTLGGKDFDARLRDHFKAEFEKKHNKCLSPESDNEQLKRLLIACEQVKIKLSTSSEAKLEIDSFFDDIDFSCSITRDQFKNCCGDLSSRYLEPIKRCLYDAKLGVFQIDEIVPIGGSTHIPAIRTLLKDFFNGKQLCSCSIEPEEAVVYGAAVQAARLSNDPSESLCGCLLVDVTKKFYGIKFLDGVMVTVVMPNSTFPTSKTVTISTYVDGQPRALFLVYEEDEILEHKNLIILGKVDICNLPPLPKGEPQIVITFNVEPDCTLHVSAKLKLNTKFIREYPMIPDTHGRLTCEQIEQMMQRADFLDAIDRKEVERIAARKSLQTMISQVQSGLEMQSQNVFAEIDQIRQWLEGNDAARRDEFIQKRQQLPSVCSELVNVITIIALMQNSK